MKARWFKSHRGPAHAVIHHDVNIVEFYCNRFIYHRNYTGAQRSSKKCRACLRIIKHHEEICWKPNCYEKVSYYVVRLDWSMTRYCWEHGRQESAKQWERQLQRSRERNE